MATKTVERKIHVPAAQTPTSTALTSSANPSTFNQHVTFTATVTSPAGTPGGTITFRDGATVLGQSPLDSTGKATLTVGGFNRSPQEAR